LDVFFSESRARERKEWKRKTRKKKTHFFDLEKSREKKNDEQDLYPRLYSLLTPQAVGSRDRAQFFTLLDAALASRMVRF
jgi:hypothetical protein